MFIRINKIFLVTLLCVLFLGSALLAQDAATKESNSGYIDVHLHLIGNINGGNQGPGQMMRRNPGMRIRSSGGRKDYEAAAERLISVMDELGIEKAVIMPPPQSEGQKGRTTYEEFMETVERYRDRLAFMAGGDKLNPMIMAVEASEVTPLMRKKFEETALQILADAAAGFGEMAALHFSFQSTHPFEQAEPDHPLFLLLADIAAEHQVPIDLHMEAVLEDQALPEKLAQMSANNPAVIKATIPGFERLLEHNQNAKIVWQHVGWDNTGQMTTHLVRRLLLAHHNLYCAFKFVRKSYESFQAGEGLMDENMKVRPEWVELMREFPDRFMIGSDSFVGAPGVRRIGPPSFADTWALIDQLPEELKKKIGRFYV